MLSRRSLLGRGLSALGLAAVAPVAKLATLLPDDPRATFTPSGSATAPLSFDGPPPPPHGGPWNCRCFLVPTDPRLIAVDPSECVVSKVCDLPEPWPVRANRIRSHFRVTYGAQTGGLSRGTWVPFSDALSAWNADARGSGA